MTVISLIVARAKNGVIGRQGQVPWRLADDLRHFRKTTLGKTLIIGRKTYDSLPTTLAGRNVIVLSRRVVRPLRYNHPHVRVEHTLSGALLVGLGIDAEEIVICGGAEVYKKALPFVSKVYLTTVDAQPKGDTTFNHWFAPWSWRTTNKEVIQAREDRNDHSATITTLVHRWRWADVS